MDNYNPDEKVIVQVGVKPDVLKVLIEWATDMGLTKEQACSLILEDGIDAFVLPLLFKKWDKESKKVKKGGRCGN